MSIAVNVNPENENKTVTLTLTGCQLEAICGAMDIVGIELAEKNDPYLPIHNNAHEAIIKVLESNFSVNNDINPDFDEDDENQKSLGKTHKLRVYLHGKNSPPTSVYYFYSKLEAYRYCDTSGIERDGVPVCTMEL